MPILPRTRRFWRRSCDGLAGRRAFKLVDRGRGHVATWEASISGNRSRG
ncbi:MAG: hypothetical protein AVDCRST_MAG33-2434 [uncultured Thermomicrobiales bacterium]|uniref:Uncharacterized protein n=1 Tax=uncultured Thermomicrobiales bacterium TaxID=1645740 RepID=A0A6J4V6G5_9BACT|nr:MAG: hypothetical protein AVDCRST_MAG33-2434 [uncultured Thermomicrobiales bacterium]